MTYCLNLLTTIRYYSSNPASIYSVGVLATCLVVAFVLNRKRLRYSKTRQLLALTACLLSLCAGLATTSSRYPGTDLLAAAIVCLAFSVGFGVSAIRGPMLTACVVAYGLNSLTLFGIAASAIGGLDTVFSEYRRTRWLSEEMTVALAALPPLTWLVGSYWLLPRLRRPNLWDARLARGLCPNCAYDLRGTETGSACPECGQAIEWSRVTLGERV